VHVLTDSYIAPATGMPVAGDTIRFAIKRPIGSIVYAVMMQWEAQVATATLSLGITGSVAKYMAAQLMTSAGVAIAPTLFAESNLVSTAEEELIGTLATAGFAASKGVKVTMFYS